MNDRIHGQACERGISRLCHFTPSRNLIHIARDPAGLLATRHLREEELALFNPTDIQRIDGFLDYVCCSIQYPNAWYFRKAREQEPLFEDWAVLLISPDYIWKPGTKFCPRNAAALGGQGVSDGIAGFNALFAPSVEGSQGRIFQRGQKPDCVPTDDQAEVLIPDQVDRRDIQAVVVRDIKQAKREHFRLDCVGTQVPIRIAPQFFNPRELSRILSKGRFPIETEYEAGSKHA